MRSKNKVALAVELSILILFFLNLAVFYIGENKKKSKIYIFFFLKCKNLGRRIRKPRNKKKLPKQAFYNADQM